MYVVKTKTKDELVHKLFDIMEPHILTCTELNQQCRCMHKFREVLAELTQRAVRLTIRKAEFWKEEWRLMRHSEFCGTRCDCRTWVKNTEKKFKV